MAVAAKPLRVLYVEDEESDAILLERALRKGGNVSHWHWVPSVDAAEKFLAACARENLPDMVISDLKMPGRSGLEFLQWLRTSDYRAIPVLMMSTSAQTSDVNRAYELGANSYFSKPLTNEELTSLVATISAYWNQCHLPRRAAP